MFAFEISQKQEMKNVKQEDEEYQREEKKKNEMYFFILCMTYVYIQPLKCR